MVKEEKVEEATVESLYLLRERVRFCSAVNIVGDHQNLLLYTMHREALVQSSINKANLGHKHCRMDHLTVIKLKLVYYNLFLLSYGYISMQPSFYVHHICNSLYILFSKIQMANELTGIMSPHLH